MLAPLSLEEPSASRKAEFLAFCQELAVEGPLSDLQLLAKTDFDRYLRRVQAMSAGRDLPDGLVPMTIFWLIGPEGSVVGESRFRHYLNAGLEVEGGNIGYIIRPSFRRRGFGTQILALTLEKARGQGLSRVLVTCDSDNVASARIIEKNGGVASEPTLSPDSGALVSRYWIGL